jgi:hypothetical protein
MNKSLFLIMLLILMSGCSDLFNKPDKNRSETTIPSSVSMKLETPFVKDDVKLTVSVVDNGEYSIKILDITNKVLSKENTTLNVGDNELTMYARVLPSSAYRIGIYDNNDKLLVITDFNKL